MSSKTEKPMTIEDAAREIAIFAGVSPADLGPAAPSKTEKPVEDSVGFKITSYRQENGRTVITGIKQIPEVKP